MHETINIPGKYRNLITKLSKLVLDNIISQSTFSKQYDVILFKEIINEDIPLHFYVGLQTKHSDNLFVIGDAYNPTEKISTQIPYIEISIGTNGNKLHRSKIALRLRNTFRHEIEHITQSGLNTLPGKYLPDDQNLRKFATEKEYLLLDKEIPAMLQGLYLQSKKERTPLLEKINEYLQKSYLLESDVNEIKSIWISKAKELNIWNTVQ